MLKYIEEVNIVPDGGVIKKVIKKGHGEKPKKNQEVLVQFEGRFENGTVFDYSQVGGEPFKIIVGAGEVVEGWDKSLFEM